MSRRNKRATITAETEEHFIRMTEWLAMESEAEIERMAERRKARDSAQAEKSGETLLDLVIEESDSGLGGRHLLTLVKRNREQRMPWHRLRVGSPVVMSTYPNEDGDSYQGVVSAKKNNSIQVALSRYPEGKTVPSRSFCRRSDSPPPLGRHQHGERIERPTRSFARHCHGRIRA